MSVKRTVVRVALWDGVRTCTIDVQTRLAHQVATGVTVRTIGHTALIGRGGREVACPAIELVSEEFEVVGSCPYLCITQLCLRLEVHTACQQQHCCQCYCIEYILFHNRRNV